MMKMNERDEMKEVCVGVGALEAIHCFFSQNFMSFDHSIKRIYYDFNYCDIFVSIINVLRIMIHII